MRNVACGHTMLFNTYIKSKRHKFQKAIEKEEKRKELDDYE